MRVWLYYRLSRDEDKELNSLTNQKQILVDYCNTQGYAIVGESFDDNVSGMHFDRDGIEKIYEEVEKKSITRSLSRTCPDWEGTRHRPPFLSTIFVSTISECYRSPRTSTQATRTMSLSSDSRESLTICTAATSPKKYARDTSKNRSRASLSSRLWATSKIRTPAK